MNPEDLTTADREIAQMALLRSYLGRMDRLTWDRHFIRDRITHYPRPRVYSLKKFNRDRVVDSEKRIA